MTISTLDDSLKPRTFNIELRNAARSGGVSLSGLEQRVFSPTARWEITAEFPITNSTQVNAWRALVARLRMGEDIILPISDLHRPSVTGAATAMLSADADVGDTTLAITGDGLTIDPGHHLTLSNRLYLVTQVTSEVGTNQGTITAITGSANWSDAMTWFDDQAFVLAVNIVPRIRGAEASGATVRLNALKCRCILADVNEGDIGLEYGRWGLPSIRFVESQIV